MSLLRWTLDPQQAPRFESLDSTARQGVRERLKETAGAVGGAVADCLEAANGSLAVPIGLALGVVFADDVGQEETVALRQGAVRVERLLNGMPNCARRGGSVENSRGGCPTGNNRYAGQARCDDTC